MGKGKHAVGRVLRCRHSESCIRLNRGLFRKVFTPHSQVGCPFIRLETPFLPILIKCLGQASNLCLITSLPGRVFLFSVLVNLMPRWHVACGNLAIWQSGSPSLFIPPEPRMNLQHWREEIATSRWYKGKLCDRLFHLVLL